MGYTHYFSGLFCNQEIVNFAFDAILMSKVSIRGPLGDNLPELSMNPPRIALNGDADKDECFESFALPATEAGDGYCKTGRLPYDEVVTAILIAAMVLNVTRAETIRSDGDFEDWKESGGIDLFYEVFNMDRERSNPRYNYFKVPLEKENLESALRWMLDEAGDDERDFGIFLGKLRGDKESSVENGETKQEKEKLLVRYHSDQLEHLQYIGGEKSDWIDLRAAEDIVLKQGEFKLISLGISVKIPKGYEMVIVPRSSTFKNFGILQTNSFGVIDESYCGDNDILRFPALAMRDTKIHVNDRICQFRIQRHQPSLEICEVEHLDGKDRGGFGSTGKN